MFAIPGRLVPLRANGQLAFACYTLEPGAEAFRLGAVNLLSLRAGQIVQIAGFLDPDVHRHLGLFLALPGESSHAAISLGAVVPRPQRRTAHAADTLLLGLATPLDRPVQG